MVFVVGFSCNTFIKNTHVPTDAHQLFTPGSGQSFYCIAFNLIFKCVGQISASQRRAIEYLVPAGNDFSGVPVFRFVGVDVEYYMVMIGHDCIGAYIQSENLGELQNAGLYPASAVFVVHAGKLVPPTEKGSADAAGHAVVVGRGFE